MFDSGCGVPVGWVRKVCQRKSGRTAGKYDVYIYSPQGRKFRSRKELAAYLTDTGSALSISEFNFSCARDVCRAGCAGLASPTYLPGDHKALPEEPSPSAGDNASTSGVSATNGVSVPPAPVKDSEEPSARPNEAPTTATARVAIVFGEDPEIRDEAAEKAKDVAIDKETQIIAAEKPELTSSAECTSNGSDQVVKPKHIKLKSLLMEKFHLLERQPTVEESMTPEPKDDPERGRAIEAARDRPQRADEANGEPAVESSEPKENPRLSLAPQQKRLEGMKTSSKERHRLGQATADDAKPNSEKKLRLKIKNKLVASRKNKLNVSSSLFKKFERVPASKIHSISDRQQPDAKDEPQPGPSLGDKKEATPSEGSIELKAKSTGEAKQNSEPKKHPCGALKCNLTACAQSNLDRVAKASSASCQPPVGKKIKTKKKLALKRKFVEDDLLFTEFHLIKRVPVPKGTERK